MHNQLETNNTSRLNLLHIPPLDHVNDPSGVLNRQNIFYIFSYQQARASAKGDERY